MSEIERLRDRVEVLEQALGLNLRLPNDFGLTPLECKIIGPFARHDIVSRDMMFAAAYGSLPECDQPEIKTIEVHLVKIRRKLKPRGFTIKNYYGAGYYIDAATREEFKKLYLVKHKFRLPEQGVPA